MEHRSRCPIHDGSNPTQFWVDFAEGNFCCFSCGEKGPSACFCSNMTSEKRGLPLGAMTLDRVAVTTNPGGATAWKREYGYGRYFTGKVVIKLGDNDGPGKLHDRDSCADIATHPLKTFTLELPVSEGEDVSDFPRPVR